MPNNMVLLETIALTQSAASVTFDNLPTSGYTDLKIVVSARGPASYASGTMDTYIRFNGTTTGYSDRLLYGTGSAATSLSETPTGINFRIVGESSTASTFGNAEIYIPNYTSSNNKSVSIDAVTENNATAVLTQLEAGLWSNTAAITSISFIPFTTGFAANSTFSLYGIAALGTTPVLAPKATGGNIIDFDGTYWIHTFTSSGTFTPQVGLTCDYLVIAGGGAGKAGGGGAGGYRSGSSYAVTTPISVTVGAGGTVVAGSGQNPTSGSNSVFDTITSAGGGAGGVHGAASGTAGGSGGGGGGAFSGLTTGGAGNTPSTSPSQGNKGGDAIATYSQTSYGGGGGAGAAAANTSVADTGTAGGAGISSSINGTATTRGGGGGGKGNVTSGAGGSGGGGAASTSGNGTSGTANTGGGGGAAPTLNNAGQGGSGIVIIRYPAA